MTFFPAEDWTLVAKNYLFNEKETVLVESNKN